MTEYIQIKKSMFKGLEWSLQDPSTGIAKSAFVKDMKIFDIELNEDKFSVVCFLPIQRDKYQLHVLKVLKEQGKMIDLKTLFDTFGSLESAEDHCNKLYRNFLTIFATNRKPYT